MPNPKTYTLLGPKSLVRAAEEELLTLPNIRALNASAHWDCLKFCSDTLCYFLGQTSTTYMNSTTLTLPQDWDQLMDILEKLKAPKAPEYVRAGLANRVYKVFGSREGQCGTNLKVYNAYGHEDLLQPNGYDVITEEEFIQGGLKELEEAGFKVGVKVKYPIYNGGTSFQISEILYSSPTHRAEWHSSLSGGEEREKGFVFGLKGEYNHVPVGQCTLLPKALPTTSQGIPYLPVKHSIHLGVSPVVSLHLGTIKHWKNLGVSSITLPCGTLTKEDLLTLSSL